MGGSGVQVFKTVFGDIVTTRGLSLYVLCMYVCMHINFIYAHINEDIYMYVYMCVYIYMYIYG